MEIKLSVTIELRKGGQIIIRHKSPDPHPPPDDENMFGLTTAGGSEALLACLANLPEWILSRFRLEYDETIMRFKDDKKRLEIAMIANQKRDAENTPREK